MVRAPEVQAEAIAAEAHQTAARAKPGQPKLGLPWEDAFTGLGLALSARGAGLAAVHIGWSVSAEQWGFRLAPASLLWHMKMKVPNAQLNLDC